MTDWQCRACRARVAPGAPRCPECPSTEFDKPEPEAEMLKIARDGNVTDSAEVLAEANAGLGAEIAEHPGTGELMQGVEAPADGTMSPLVGNAVPGTEAFMIEGGSAVPEGIEVLTTPAEGAAAAPAPAVPSRVPPRRTPPPGAPGD